MAKVTNIEYKRRYLSYPNIDFTRSKMMEYLTDIVNEYIEDKEIISIQYFDFMNTQDEMVLAVITEK